MSVNTVTSSNQWNAPETTDGCQYGKAASSKQAFFGVSPIVQPASPTGDTHAPTAGGGAAVKVDTTFDGSSGSTAYTIGDIVLALKNLGLIAK